MRQVEIEYNLPANIPGDPDVTITINFEIEFQRDRDGIRVVGYPETVYTTVGKISFDPVKWRDIDNNFPLYGWVKDRASELTIEKCGYTEKEAMQEYADDEDEIRYQQSQIGRPI